MSEKSISKMLFSNQEKVELALIDDVNNLYKKGFDLYDVQSELLKAQDKVKKSKSFFEQSQKAATDALAKSKELGASDFMKLFNDKEQQAKAAIKSADSLISAIDRAITIL
tara:strand:- start:64 stop:396 length:333 start_codon:yes stop_codon:yes gene_type:complete